MVFPEAARVPNHGASLPRKTLRVGRLLRRTNAALVDLPAVTLTFFGVVIPNRIPGGQSISA